MEFRILGFAVDWIWIDNFSLWLLFVLVFDAVLLFVYGSYPIKLFWSFRIETNFLIDL